MREIDEFPVGHIILAGIDTNKEKRYRGSGRKIIVAEDGRRLPHSLLPIELAILGRALLLDEKSGEAREVTPNMLVAEFVELADQQKAYGLSYESINGALKRLVGWGYMSLRVTGRRGGNDLKSYSITPEGLTQIED